MMPAISGDRRISPSTDGGGIAFGQRRAGRRGRNVPVHLEHGALVHFWRNELIKAQKSARGKGRHLA